MNFLTLPITVLLVVPADFKHTSAPNKINTESASCSRQVPAYMVVNDHKLIDDSQSILKFRNTTKANCKIACSDNENKKTGKSILCASFTYSDEDQTCLVHTQRARPAGRSDLIPEKGHRYYEKFCLPSTAPTECGEGEFFRAQSAILTGFAIKLVHTKYLDACVGACVQENQDCKSAMFFYDSGECIINSGTAADRPDSFLEEPQEKVVYFENGCVVEDQLRSQEIVNEDADDEQTDATRQRETIGSTIDLKDENNEAVLLVTETIEKSIAVAPSMGPWSPWSQCDVPNGRRMRRRDCLSSDPDRDCAHKLIETQWCMNNEPDSSTTRQPTTSEPKFFGSLKAPEADFQDDNQKRVIIKQSDEKWGNWSQRCQPFTPDKPCDPHWRFKMGFQTRQCLGSACDGPFMRYCFIPCVAKL